MGDLSTRIGDAHGARRESSKAPKFVPAGQSTQVIVGADASSDVDVLRMSANLYGSYRLKRVYYSAFSPIPDASALLPLSAPPLVREHRLYQADWLYRFYGFTVDEISSATRGGMFDAAVDPKLAWALANRQCFPVDVNAAPKEMLLRVPGLGTKVVKRIIETRREHSLRLADLQRLTGPTRKLLPFVTAVDWHPGRSLDSPALVHRLKPKAQQLDLFAA
jgi:predicted DNA-binding helix-hairpin-helix protein